MPSIRQETHELTGTPGQDAAQIENGYKTARQRFGNHGLTSMIESRMHEESSARGTAAGMDAYDRGQENTITHTKQWTTRADDGLSM